MWPPMICRSLADDSQLHPAAGGTLSRQLDAQADKYIDYSVGGAIRMQALIQDLLKFSRVANKKLNPERRLSPCCGTGSKESASRRAGEWRCGELEWFAGCYGRPLQLTQVFQNLIANAIKFRGPNSHYSNRRRKKRPRMGTYSFRQWHWYSGRELAGYLRYLPASAYPHRIFRQWDGLSICKKIVERYGGKSGSKPKPNLAVGLNLLYQPNHFRTQHGKHSYENDRNFAG